MDLDALLAPTRALGARWSISIRRDGDAAVLEHDPLGLVRTASVAKVFVLIELAERLVQGGLDAALVVDRASTPPVRDSGLWYAMRTDALPVSDLAVLVGAVSDNWATNALLHLLGLDRVRERAGSLAPGGSTLFDLVRDERTAGLPATFSAGCARDWVTIVQRLRHADGLDPAACRLVREWLAQDTDLSMVASAFGLDPLAHDVEDLGLRLWHKTGTDDGVRADVGAVASRGAVVSYAVLCNWPVTDVRAQTRRAVLSTMNRIGEEIQDLLEAAG